MKYIDLNDKPQKQFVNRKMHANFVIQNYAINTYVV